MIAIVLAQGFEDVEALAPWDILQRLEQEVVLVGLSEQRVRSQYGAQVLCSTVLQEVNKASLTGIVLPGGSQGAKLLAQSSLLGGMLQYLNEKQLLIAAICAAPVVVLEPLRLLEGKRFTGYPSFTPSHGELQKQDLVRDGHLITASAMGAAMAFGFCIGEFLLENDPQRDQKLLDLKKQLAFFELRETYSLSTSPLSL